MGNIDVLSKQFMSDNEIFADAFNFLLYGGKQKIKPEDLSPLDTNSISVEINDTKVYSTVQKNRDVFKILSAKKTDKVGLLILGVENQAKIHYAMPVRTMLYDSLQYASQVDLISKKNRKSKKCSNSDEFLSSFTRKDRLIPVITLVVYFGSLNWDGATNIKDMFIDVDESVAKYLPNYHINLISPKLSDSELSKLKSELGVVMQFIKNSSDKNRLLKSLEKNKRLQKVSNISATLIKETTGLNLKISKEKEFIDMNKGVKELLDDTKKEGKKEGKLSAFYDMIKQGLITLDQAANSLGISTKQLLADFKECNLVL